MVVSNRVRRADSLNHLRRQSADKQFEAIGLVLFSRAGDW